MENNNASPLRRSQRASRIEAR